MINEMLILAEDESMPFGAKLLCAVIFIIVLGVFLLNRFKGSGRPPR